MSLSLGEELRVLLSPTRAQALRVERGMQRSRVFAEKSLSCSAAGSAPIWRPAVDALAQLLPEVRGRAGTVQVLLADHFCRYLLVPWQENLKDEGELEVLARLRLRDVYGDAARHWALRVSPSAFGAPYLACAVDAELVRVVADLCAAHKLKLDAMQPLLAAAYNHGFGRGSQSEPWFVERFDDRFVLCRVERRAWRSIRSEPVGADFTQSLKLAIERESMALGIEVADEPIVQCAPQMDGWMAMAGARSRHDGVSIDFGSARSGSPSVAGAALAVAGIAAALFTVQQYVVVADDVEVQEAAVQELRRSVRRDQRRIPESPEQSRQVQLEVRMANAIIDRMVVPWDALFHSIESAADQSVALLSIQPNVNASQVRISGEAGSYEAILEYARRIGRSELLDQVHLAEHAIKAQQPQQPIGFLLVARWKKSP